MTSQQPAPTALAARQKHKAAEALDVSVDTVGRWIADGLLDAVKVGQIVLVTEDSIQRLLRGGDE